MAAFKASLEAAKAELEAAEREDIEAGLLSDDEDACFGPGARELCRGHSTLQVGVESRIPPVLESTMGLRHHM